MRRVAALIDPADVIGLIGLGLLAYASWLFDTRLPPLVVGVALILLSIAYARRITEDRTE